MSKTSIYHASYHSHLGHMATAQLYTFCYNVFQHRGRGKPMSALSLAKLHLDVHCLCLQTNELKAAELFFSLPPYPNLKIFKIKSL